MSNWINFAELREQLVFADVLAYYKVEVTPRGTTNQSVGICPLPNHENRKGKTFSANLVKGLWQCFGCKEGGNVIDFAVLMEGKDKKNGQDVRNVALSLQERFVKESKTKPPPRAKKQSAPKSAPQPSNERPQSVEVNAPLDFALKTLEPEHPYFAEHKLTTETIERFGLGFCKRGSLAGRIAVPLHDDEGQLIAYTGLVTDDKLITATNPKYLFPPKRELDGVSHVFDKGKFLYSGFRIGSGVKDLIVVQECRTVWSLWQAGFDDVVGLMGNECSLDQAAMIGLVTVPAARIWLLTAEDPSGEECARSLLVQLASSRLCRWIRVEEQEEIAPDHPLLTLLPRR